MAGWGALKEAGVTVELAAGIGGGGAATVFGA